MSGVGVRIEVSNQAAYIIPSTTVSGTVCVSVTKAVSPKSIKVIFLGEMEATNRIKLVGMRSLYKEHSSFISQEFILWSPPSGQKGELGVGEHRFPFTMDLSSSQPLPPSFSDTYAKIMYKLQAVVDILRNKVQSELDIQYCGVIDISDPKYETPVQLVHRINCFECCFFDKGQASCELLISRNGALPGETLDINIHITNNSDFVVRNIHLDFIQQSVVQGEDFCNQDKQITDLYRHKDIEARSGLTSIAVHQAMIPATTLMYMNNRFNVYVQHWVQLSMYVDSQGVLAVRLPVIIGNMRSKGPLASQQFRQPQSSLQ